MQFVPGDTVPLSGVYRVEHKSHRLMPKQHCWPTAVSRAVNNAEILYVSNCFGPWSILRCCRSAVMPFSRSTPNSTRRKPPLSS